MFKLLNVRKIVKTFKKILTQIYFKETKYSNEKNCESLNISTLILKEAQSFVKGLYILEKGL